MNGINVMDWWCRDESHGYGPPLWEPKRKMVITCEDHESYEKLAKMLVQIDGYRKKFRDRACPDTCGGCFFKPGFVGNYDDFPGELQLLSIPVEAFDIQNARRRSKWIVGDTPDEPYDEPLIVGN